jgi:hypothetical protein
MEFGKNERIEKLREIKSEQYNFLKKCGLEQGWARVHTNVLEYEYEYLPFS